MGNTKNLDFIHSFMTIQLREKEKYIYNKEIPRPMNTWYLSLMVVQQRIEQLKFSIVLALIPNIFIQTALNMNTFNHAIHVHNRITMVIVFKVRVKRWFKSSCVIGLASRDK